MVSLVSSFGLGSGCLLGCADGAVVGPLLGPWKAKLPCSVSRLSSALGGLSFSWQMGLRLGSQACCRLVHFRLGIYSLGFGLFVGCWDLVVWAPILAVLLLAGWQRVLLSFLWTSFSVLVVVKAAGGMLRGLSVFGLF
ncbi:hypothetical protein OIU76_020363 [Salix suchowensis]|nr:hypothetical protein OIU76_020363 [Salix suchowensis]